MDSRLKLILLMMVEELRQDIKDLRRPVQTDYEQMLTRVYKGYLKVLENELEAFND